MGEDFAALCSQARHSGTEEQAFAARSLGEHGDPRAVPVLLQLLDATADDEVRNVTALALRDLGDPRAVPALARHIAEPRNPRNIGTLLYSLAPLDARAALLPVVRAMIDGNYEVLAMGLQVIEGFMGPPPPDDVDRALALVRAHLARRDYEDWQREMLETVVEQLGGMRA